MKEVFNSMPGYVETRNKKTEKNDALSEEKVEQWAKSILNYVGLEISDLRGKRVLDLGCGPAMLERFARKNEIDVVSIDNEPLNISKRADLSGRVAGDARELPFFDESFDLIISAGAAPPYFGSFGEEEDTLSSMKEIQRVLKGGGEVRIVPSDFGFINKYWELPENLQKPWKDLSAKEKEKRMEIGERAREKSFQFLKANGYNVEEVPLGKKRKFWLMKKPEALPVDDQVKKKQRLFDRIWEKLMKY